MYKRQTEKRVNAVYAMGDYFGIQASGEILEASTVILAAGIVMGKPFPGENELLGSGVSYCATCDAQFFRGKEVAVIGYGREAEQEADYLAEIVGKVHYFPMGKEEPQLSDAVEMCIRDRINADAVHFSEVPVLPCKCSGKFGSPGQQIRNPRSPSTGPQTLLPPAVQKLPPRGQALSLIHI